MRGMGAEVVIIGAGMSGLACARRLAQAGRSPLILDKGQGIGGRMATRRVMLTDGEVRFDHGAQYVTARDPGFAALLKGLSGAVAVWDDGAGIPLLVGLPGMSDLPRAMAKGLEVRQAVEVTSLRQTDQGWVVQAGGEDLVARRVVLTVPAPQVTRLLDPAHPLVAPLARVEMAPCLTLMTAFPADAARPFVSRVSDTHPLAWIAQDSTKPSRSGPATTWVAQASPEWSARYLEESAAAIAARLLPLLCAEIGTAPSDALHTAAHRWRFARVTAPLGEPFLRSDDGALYLGGDWCLGPRVEAAWQSGEAIARDILGEHDVG